MLDGHLKWRAFVERLPPTGTNVEIMCLGRVNQSTLARQKSALAGINEKHVRLVQI